MKVEERLAKLFTRGGITFSIETLESAKALITITRYNGSTSDTVGGSYDSIDEGLTDCLDKLDKIKKKRSRLKVVKA